MANKSAFITLIARLKGKGIEEATKDFKKLGGQFDKLNKNALRLTDGFQGHHQGHGGLFNQRLRYGSVYEPGG